MLNNMCDNITIKTFLVAESVCKTVISRSAHFYIPAIHYETDSYLPSVYHFLSSLFFK